MSTKPGVTSFPSASIVRFAASSIVADGGDPIALDSNVRVATGTAGTVDDRAVPDGEIVSHASSLWTYASAKRSDHAEGPQGGRLAFLG